MLVGRILTSPYAHARVVRIDTSKAKALPGVAAVLTHEDVPKLTFTRSVMAGGSAALRLRGREPGPVHPVRQGALRRRLDRRGGRRRRLHGREGPRPHRGGVRGAAGRVRSRGGPEAGRAGGPRALEGQRRRRHRPPLQPGRSGKGPGRVGRRGGVQRPQLPAEAGPHGARRGGGPLGRAGEAHGLVAQSERPPRQEGHGPQDLRHRRGRHPLDHRRPWAGASGPG